MLHVVAKGLGEAEESQKRIYRALNRILPKRTSLHGATKALEISCLTAALKKSSIVIILYAARHHRCPPMGHCLPILFQDEVRLVDRLVHEVLLGHIRLVRLHQVDQLPCVQERRGERNGVLALFFPRVTSFSEALGTSRQTNRTTRMWQLAPASLVIHMSFSI